MTEQEKTWIAQCATRLRLVQADAAGLAPEKRREFLSEEVSRKLKELPKPAHKRHLEALLAQFPVEGSVTQTSVAAPPPPAEIKPPVATFDDVFECFLRLEEELSEAQRAAVKTKLVETGLWEERAGSPEEVAQKLRKELGLAPNQEFQLGRVAELAAALTELICRLDQAAFGTLKQLSPRNPLLKAENLRRIIGQFLLTDRPLAAKAFEKLFGAMLVALQEGGAEFSRHYLEVMLPENIWNIVKSDARVWENKKELAWERYRELAEEYETSEQINKKIREAMGAAIDTALNA